eukprot:2120579-Rhodomonas_salina.6
MSTRHIQTMESRDSDLLEEERNLGMGFGVASRLEERLEDIGHHRREVVHILDRLAMDVIQPRDLRAPIRAQT